MNTTFTAVRPSRRTAVRAGFALALGVSMSPALGAAAPAGAATGDSVWTAGLNSSGELGNGTLKNRPSFGSVASMAGVDDIAGGRQHVLALRDGTVYAWGDGNRGAVGSGSTDDLLVPSAVRGLTGVASITTGHYGSYALMGDRTVRAWGYNTSGQLGDGTLTRRLVPVTVKKASGAALDGVKQVAAGRDFAMAVIAQNGSVRTWGRGTDGELGNGTTPTAQRTPVVVKTASGTTLTGVTQVAAGRNHSLALRSDGSVWAWGENGYGQVGDGTLVDKLRAVKVTGLSGVVDVEAGAEFSVAVLGNGSVMTWGRSGNGQLGNGFKGTRTVPGQVPGLTDVVGAGCGRDHTVVWTRSGQAYGWGLDTYGQLGDGGATKRLSPVRIPGVDGVTKAHGGFGYTVLRRTG